MLRILGRITSINVRKAVWAAEEMGLNYEREDWGLPLRDPKVPEFLALNPNAQVPVLIDGDFVLWESNAIMRYLGEKEPGPAWPQDLRQRALADQWLTWQATELNPQWGYAVQALMRRNPAFNDEARRDESIRNWSARMAILEGQLERTEAYVAGKDFTLADIALSLSVHRWFSTPFVHPYLPQVAAYYERCKARPAGARYLTEATP